MPQTTEVRFAKAVLEIKNSGLEPFAGLAARGIQRLTKEGIGLEINRKPQRLRAATIFGMLPVPNSPTQEHTALIIVDPGIVESLNDIAFQADVIRTLAVMDQFPDKGFERRLKLVYGQALDTRAAWLKATDAPLTNLDAEPAYREELVKHLLGPAKYTFDAGFDDWQFTIDEILEGGENEANRPILTILRSNLSHFIVQRQVQQPGMQASVNSGRLNLEGLDENKRAQLFCASVAGSSVLFKPDTQN